MAPLTETVPKPLLPALNCPLVMWNLRLLSTITSVVSINTHHLSERFAPIVSIGTRYNMSMQCIRETSLSGPFGGVRACYLTRSAPEDIVVLTGDGFFQADLPALLRHHRKHHADLTMGVASVPDGSRYGVLSSDDSGRVLAMREKPPNIGAVSSASCGVYIVSRRVLEMVPSAGVLDWIDIVTFLLNKGKLVLAAPVDLWLDAGSPADLVALNLRLLGHETVDLVAERMSHRKVHAWSQGPLAALDPIEACQNVLFGAGATFDAGISLTNVVVGTRAHIGAGAILEDVVVLPDARVPANARVSGAVCR